MALLVHSVFTLITLLFEDPSADAISPSELPSIDVDEPLDDRLQQIPKILHQTYKNETIPEHWLPAQKSCRDLHPDYEYILWTDADSRELIRTEYPWFLDTFDGYPYAIQRADAIRYFVLSHFGGVYLDLDDGCNRRLDPLLTYSSWVRHTVPKGISNDAMGATPKHPFFVRVTESLQAYDRSWLLPYITIMYSTGPLFLSVIWKKWTSEHGAQAGREWPGRVRILMKAEYNSNPWSFFQHYRGSSWHRSDARLIFWMGRNWLFLTVSGFLLAGVAMSASWWLYRRYVLGGLFSRGDRGHHRFRASSDAWVPDRNSSGGNVNSRKTSIDGQGGWLSGLIGVFTDKSGRRQQRSISSFWRRWGGYKQLARRRSGGEHQYYELDQQWDP